MMPFRLNRWPFQAERSHGDVRTSPNLVIGHGGGGGAFGSRRCGAAHDTVAVVLEPHEAVSAPMRVRQSCRRQANPTSCRIHTGAASEPLVR